MKKTALIPTLLLSALFPFFVFAQVNVSTNLITTSVELMWESHAYIPPLYPGKALYPVGGEVTVLALPPSSFGNPNTLSYTWKKDGLVIGTASGTGKRSFTFSGSEFGESPLITVAVSNGTKTEFGSARIAQTEPFVQWYEKKPLEGVSFDTVLPRNVITNEKSIDIEAYPYFFSAPSRFEDVLSYSWSANGTKLPDAFTGSFSVQTEEPSVVQIQLSVSNLKQVLQHSTKSISLNFQ